MSKAAEPPGDREDRGGLGSGVESIGVPLLHPFLVTPAQALGLPVCRLGLASYGQTAITPEDILYALSRGLNFLNWQGLAEGPSSGDAFCSAVAALGTHRRSVVVLRPIWSEKRCGCRGGIAVGPCYPWDRLHRCPHPLLCRASRRVGRDHVTRRGALPYLRDAKRERGCPQAWCDEPPTDAGGATWRKAGSSISS